MTVMVTVLEVLGVLAVLWAGYVVLAILADVGPGGIRPKPEPKPSKTYTQTLSDGTTHEYAGFGSR